ncbi:MAG: hypothetical protein WCF17_15295 [Terracidiphilus sp.]
MRKGPAEFRSLRKHKGDDRPSKGIEIQKIDGRPANNAGSIELSVERILRPRRDSYSEKVIDDPRRFDAIEVHGICKFSDPEGSSYEEPEYDRVKPSAFGVFAHLKDGGVDCCGDFGQRSDALAYGTELASIHHWPMYDCISSGRQYSSEAQCRDALLTMAVTLRTGCIQALDPLDGSFEDDRSVISAVRSVYEAGIAEIRRQLEASKDQFRSKVKTIDGQ